MPIPTWKVAESKMSVRVNGLDLPFRSAPDIMQRFVRPALFSTGYAGFELRYFGTALLVRYRSRHFALATAHQTDETRGAPSAETFVVVAGDEGKRFAVPPTSAKKPRIEEVEFKNLEDLVFFDYEEKAEGRGLSFLNISDMYWSDATDLRPDYSFVIGYPSSSVIMELDLESQSQLAEFTLRWIRQDLERVPVQSMDPENRIMFVKHQRSTRLSIDPDGLSGSPVFSIVHDDRGDRHLRFEGIVTDAKDDRFAVYPSAFFRQIFDEIIDEGRK